MDFDQLKTIACTYHIQLLRPEPGYINEGGMSCDDTIWIAESEFWKEELSFWHELGHVLDIRESIASGKSHSMSILSKEGFAWEQGLTEAAKHNRHWEYHSKELEWARQCLASYVKNFVRVASEI